MALWHGWGGIAGPRLVLLVEWERTYAIVTLVAFVAIKLAALTLLTLPALLAALLLATPTLPPQALLSPPLPPLPPQISRNLWCHSTRCVRHARGWHAYGVRPVEPPRGQAALRLWYVQQARG
jgi:hypothetical protein